MSVNTCDPKSYELAEHFLQDDDVSDLTPAQIQQRTMRLALAIQQAVEDWIEDEAAPPHPSAGARGMTPTPPRLLHLKSVVVLDTFYCQHGDYEIVVAPDFGKYAKRTPLRTRETRVYCVARDAAGTEQRVTVTGSWELRHGKLVAVLERLELVR